MGEIFQNTSPQMYCATAIFCLSGFSFLNNWSSRIWFNPKLCKCSFENVSILSLTLCHILKFMLDANMHLTVFPENLSVLIFMPSLPLYIFLVLLLFLLRLLKSLLWQQKWAQSFTYLKSLPLKFCIIKLNLSLLGEKYFASTWFQPSTNSEKSS